MKLRIVIGKSVVLCLFVLLVAPALMLANAPQAPVGEITSLTGRVRVNNANAISGATVFSDSTVTTAKGSSAVVSLGKLGRVEVFPSTRMDLSFDDTSITVAMLDAGRVRVSSTSGTSARVTTKDGVISADGSQETVFVVSTECGNTLVSVDTGMVELRAGDSVKQIAAGSQDTAGQVKPGLCKHNTRA